MSHFFDQSRNTLTVLSPYGGPVTARFGFGRDTGFGVNLLDENDRELADGQTVAIKGEDLYAFRELLNNLPEEAFVRPADPVEVAPEDHGTILVDGDDEIWVFNGYVDRWFLTGPFSRLEEYTGSEIDHALARREHGGDVINRSGLDSGAEGIFEQYGGAIAAPLPRWSDGDVIRNGDTGHVYLRESGSWSCVNSGFDFGADMRFDDAEISDSVDRHPADNVVLHRANA